MALLFVNSNGNVNYLIVGQEIFFIILSSDRTTISIKNAVIYQEIISGFVKVLPMFIKPQTLPLPRVKHAVK